MTDHIEETKAKIAVMQAYVDGEPIEVSYEDRDFHKLIAFPIWNWDEYNYRIATTPDTINWSHVAPEYKWMARDADGLACLSRDKPECGDMAWTGTGFVNVIYFASYRRGNCDWKESLVERPA